MMLKTMRATTALAVLVMMCSSGCATREPAPPREPVSVKREQVISTMATVEQIDHKTRMVTLRREDGDKLIFRASEEIRNLPQVQVGDHVVASYYEAIAAEVRPPTDEERANPRATTRAGGRAPVGEMPAAAVAQSTRVVATITGIDRNTDHVTLTGPEGTTTTVKARDPRNLDKVKVGDPVVITYTEAVGISVERLPKAEGPRKKK
jgi:Cu/Ag efflux protein CusF